MEAGNKTRKQNEKWMFSSSVMSSCSTTEQHPSAYIQIATILKNEHYHGKHRFSQEKALYLESVETELTKSQKRNRAHIVDFSIGISKGKSQKIRLVEAKFDVNDLKNIESKSILAKVKHSNDILISDGFQIENGAVVLINDSLIVQQQKRWLSQKLISHGHYTVNTIEEFYNDYFQN